MAGYEGAEPGNDFLEEVHIYKIFHLWSDVILVYDSSTDGALLSQFCFVKDFKLTKI